MNEAIEKVKSQMRKGILEYCILLALKRQEAYSSDIINLLKESHLIVVEGTLYPLLTRLKNDDLLSYSWVESKQGPPRKYYRITKKGLEFLNELMGAWEEIRTTVDSLHTSLETPPTCKRDQSVPYITISDNNNTQL